jgi:hypothetical protein
MPTTKPYNSLKFKNGWKVGEQQTLNLSKSAHWDFINEQYARAGVTAKREPKVFKALSGARKPGAKLRTKAPTGDVLVGLNAIVSVGFSSEGTFASAFSAVPGGTIFTSLILELIDPVTDNVLGTASLSQFGEGEYVPIEVTGSRPSEGNEVEAIFTASYQTGSGKPITEAMRITVSEMADGPPVVGEPVKQTTDGPDLRIALGAWHSRPEYDYWYRSLNPTHPNLRLPLVGTQRYQSPIAKPFDPTISVYLIAPERGGVAMAKAGSVESLRKSLKVAGNKLSWNMPWSAKILKDRSLDFGSAAWGRLPVLLVFTIDVLTKHASNPVRTVISSGATEASGVGTIPQISYLWR